MFRGSQTLNNNLQSDAVNVEWTDGKMLGIDVVMCCEVSGPERTAYGKLPDGTRVKLTTISFGEKGMQVYVQKEVGNPKATTSKRKSTPSTAATSTKKAKASSKEKLHQQR